MTTYLYKHSVAQLVINAVRIYLESFATFIALVALFVFPGPLVVAIAKFLAPQSQPLLILSYIFLAVLSIISQFVLVGEASRVCHGGTASFRSAISHISARAVGGYCATFGLVAVVIAVPVIIFVAIVLVGSFTSSMNEALIVGGVIGTVLFAYILVRFMFLPQVIVLEKTYWIAALKRSHSIV